MIDITLGFETLYDARICARALERRAIELEQALKRLDTPIDTRSRWEREIKELYAAAEQLYAGTREPV